MLTALCEMAFASRCGLHIDLSGAPESALAQLFNEELGILLQIKPDNLPRVQAVMTEFGVEAALQRVAVPNANGRISVHVSGQELLNTERKDLHRIWSATSHAMQTLRDNPECAQQEYDRLLDSEDTGLFANLSFDSEDDISAPYIGGTKPRIAVLREQGVNGHVEMAAAFTHAGFSAIDVTMSDLSEGRVSLEDFKGLVACGGFSYGDVLGAGEGWAKSILFNTRLRDAFSAYFARHDAFALGVCNGCQMMSNLKEIIPGAAAWPHFVKNASEQFEARLVQADIPDDTQSIFMAGMQGSQLPVVVAHGEGRAEFAAGAAPLNVAMRYIDYRGQATETYPYNPNGSPHGIAGLSNDDGRVTIMMPHPERIFRTVTNSWREANWGEYGPWMRMFRNARVWLD